MALNPSRAFALMLLATAAAGCAHWQAGPNAAFTRWKCQQPSFIEWRYLDPEHRAIELRLGEGAQLIRLRREPVTAGAFYSDGVIALHRRGSEALVYRLTDDRVLARGCRASLINL